MTLEGLFSSYLVAAVLLLYRRIRGEIGERESDTNSLEDIQKRPYSWGPWRIPGMFGIINNVVACAYLILICFFSFWPTETPVTPASINYSQTV